MSVKVEVTNTAAVLKALEKRFESGLQPAAEKAKELIEAKFQNNPAGWRPLAASTLAQRQLLGFGSGPILYRTGRLQGQAVQQIQVQGNTATLSSSDPIAIIQNKTRPIYQFSDEDKKAIYEAFKSGIK
jgi:hypothetical protein